MSGFTAAIIEGARKNSGMPAINMTAADIKAGRSCSTDRLRIDLTEVRAIRPPARAELFGGATKSVLQPIMCGARHKYLDGNCRLGEIVAFDPLTGTET